MERAYSKSGEKLQLFGSSGYSRGQFGNAQGIAIDKDGNFLVADYENHCIQKFTSKGQFLKEVGKKGGGMGSGPLEFDYPSDIAINPINNKVYVYDQRSYRVQILNPDLTYHGEFGRKGTGSGQFYGSRGIAFDSSGNVYVADNYRVQVFTADGTFLRMFGNSRGEALESLKGIAIDSNDVVYVSEGDPNRVSVFTSGGQFVTSFGKYGAGPGEFNWIGSLAVHGNAIYVCDCQNDRIQISYR